jgi:hypothetical protein
VRNFPALGLREFPLPRITNLAQTLGSTICCTVCRGERVVFKKRFWEPQWKWPLVQCPECHGSGLMKSRTQEEQENIAKNS